MKRVLKWIGIVVGVLALIAGGLLAWGLRHRPWEAHRALVLPAAAPEPRALRAAFFGTSSILLDDGETAIMTDGYFTRPGKWAVAFGKVAPDVALIERSLKRAGVDKLAAVIAVHSHIDHALDAPEVARRTGALLIGSQSTANIGRGWGLPEARIHVPGKGQTFTFGRFQVSLIESRHTPTGMATGTIEAPLRPPARATDYKEGGCYSVLISHDGRNLLIHASSGFLDGALKDRKAEVVFLGIAMLGKQDTRYRDSYWREVVQQTGARRVIAIHWDDFTLPLDAPLETMPRLMDDFDPSFAAVQERAARDRVELKLPPVWERFDPYGKP
jgi:L-ascorbate metabolism protein UlaG (beta-lactamase superfamily)